MAASNASPDDPVRLVVAATVTFGLVGLRFKVLQQFKQPRLAAHSIASTFVSMATPALASNRQPYAGMRPRRCCW